MYESGESMAPENPREGGVLDVWHYYDLLRTYWWLILLMVLAAAVSGFLFSRAQTPVYRTTSTLLVVPGVGQTNEYTALLTGRQLAESYVQRLRNLEVLEQAIDELGLSDQLTAAELQAAVSTTAVRETELVTLSVEHPDPQLAAALANAIPAVFSRRNQEQQEARFAATKQGLQNEIDAVTAEIARAEQLLAAALQADNTSAIDQANTNLSRLRETRARLTQSYEDIRIIEARGLNRLIIDELARVPALDSPVRPRTATNTLLAALIGGLLAVGVIFLIDYLDDTARNLPALSYRLGLPLLGVIPRYDTANKRLIAEMEPRSSATEAYRAVRMNLRYASVDRPLRTILITSAEPEEGKSTVASNLAVVLANGGESVILIDGDLRRPNLHKAFNLSNLFGTSRLFIEALEESFESTLQSTNSPSLRVVTSGPIPPNPSELLDTRRAQEIVTYAAEHADKVLIDAPPIVALTDSLALSQHVDGVLLVLRAGKTPQTALLHAVERLRRVDANLIGLVAADADTRSARYAGYYRDYSYYHTPTAFEGNGARNGRANGLIGRLRRRAE